MIEFDLGRQEGRPAVSVCEELVGVALNKIGPTLTLRGQNRRRWRSNRLRQRRETKKIIPYSSRNYL